MAGDAVAEVKARLDLIEVIGGYVTLHRAGRELTGLCPFHPEKTPSFTVSPERQVWYCHGCHEGGDLFKFIEQIERIDFRQALEMLADRAGVELESGPAARGAGRRRRRSIELNGKAQAYYQHVLWSAPAGEAGRVLLRERGVDEALARTFGVGFAPAGGAGEDALARYLTGKGGATVDELVDAGLVHPQRGGRVRDRFRDRLVFPIRDERGEVLGFGARALGDAKPKYLNSPDSAAYHKSSAIFGLDLARAAIVREHAAVIVEGYFDVIAAHAAGVEHTVASSGTALTREQVHSLGRIAETFVLCFDGDGAGWVATARAVDVIAAEGLQARICRLPDGIKDPDELVKLDPARFGELVRDAPSGWQVLVDEAFVKGEGQNHEARRAAAERALLVIARIPEESTQLIYVDRVANRLRISPSSLASDLARLKLEGAHRMPRIIARAPADPPTAPASGGLSEPDSDDDEAMPPWEAHLARLALIKPELAAALRVEAKLNSDEFMNPSARRIFEATSSDPGGFTLRVLGEGDQRRAAGLLVREVPEFAEEAEPEALNRLISDCLKLLREESVRRELVAISQEMHRATDEGRTVDADALAAKLSRLAAKAPHLRRTLALR